MILSTALGLALCEVKIIYQPTPYRRNPLGSSATVNLYGNLSVRWVCHHTHGLCAYVARHCPVAASVVWDGQWLDVDPTPRLRSVCECAWAAWQNSFVLCVVGWVAWKHFITLSCRCLVCHHPLCRRRRRAAVESNATVWTHRHQFSSIQVKTTITRAVVVICLSSFRQRVLVFFFNSSVVFMLPTSTCTSIHTYYTWDEIQHANGTL